ncbi:porin [Collimonas silvisoli]|uniref:porin n=1 Tax=Collimonas silvisoli TaxID=2825884 RepID=UPI001B8AC08B|nr:porin [Collimonas silvisoli]
MRKIVMSAAVLCASSGVAHAQSNVTIYGIVDAAIRYSTHENAAGGSKLQEAGGPLSGSRIGFKGTEDLGGGLSALFSLEAGFGTNNGALQQQPATGTRLFGRESLVGLQGGFGKITLGRQYAVIHDMAVSNDVYVMSNNTQTIGFQGGNYTMGARLDNTIRYANTWNGVTANVAYSAGGVAGNIHNSDSKAFSLAYDSGPLHVGAAWQTLNNSTSYFSSAISAQSKQTAWTLGGTYVAGPVKWYLAYINNKLDIADYKNSSYSAGFKWNISGPWSLWNEVYFDKLKHAGKNGTRWTVAPTLDYALSKRTDVYLTVDYTKLTDAWTTLGAAAGTLYGNRLGVTTGLRHTF